jgi:Bax protein
MQRIRRIIRDLIYFVLIIFAIYLFAKTEKYNSRYWPEVIKVRNVLLTNSDSIIYQSDTTLIPVNYIGSIDFRCVNPDNRKVLFIQHLLPAIVITRERLLDDLHHLEFIEERIGKKIPVSVFDSTFLAVMKLKYETDELDELKIRVYPHPVSLALTQAVLESGWGTSPIFRKGKNIFGIMSFSKDDPRSHIQFSDGDDERYLRTYNSIEESVEHYYLLISKVSSYEKFREKRWEGESSAKLLRYMESYHESDQYTEMAQSIIASNNLVKYDNVAIDPGYKEFLSLRSYLMKY